MKTSIKPISPAITLLLFGIPTIVFLAVCRLLIPYLNQNFQLHPALSWFIGGFLVFVPLFMLAIYLIKRDGFQTKAQLLARMRLRKMSSRDWKYTIISTLLIMVISGAIMGISKFLNLQFGIPEIETTPTFMAFDPFQGNERFFLLIWILMFFFNIFGEELLWRGYILPRQEISLRTHAWFFNAILWLMFHLCFGVQLIILLIPILFILPYAVQKTRNTWVGIVIHALVNGPSFIMVSLGVIG